MKVARTTTWLALAALGATTASAAAATRHVPGQYASIQAAIDAAAADDLVLVDPGIYHEAIDFRGKRIVVSSRYQADGEQPDWSIIESTIIDGSQSDSSVVTFDEGEGPDSRLEGFTVRGGSGAPGAIRRGGGAYVKSCGPSISHCIFRDNVAEAGGGIGVVSGWPSIQHCRFEDNVATRLGENGGAGIVGYSSYLDVSHCSFVNNQSLGGARGGGLALWGGNVEIRNSLFHGNVAYYGGAIAASGGSAAIRSSTIVGNDAGYGGGALSVWYLDLSLSNCVLWSNDAPTDPELYQGSGVAVLARYTCNQSGMSGEGNFGGDPRFVDLAAGDLHLADDSPLIDAGDDDDASGIPVDLDGKNRIMATAVDLGVYESETVGPRGACCLVDGSCDVILREECIASGGHYQGDGAECAPAPCATLACTGDIDGDGSVEFDDIVAVLAAWGACEGCPEDLDGSGDVGFTEITSVLSQWGPCP